VEPGSVPQAVAATLDGSFISIAIAPIKKAINAVLFEGY
jgi:hypothetical protein